jgi:hypothetical protein
MIAKIAVGQGKSPAPNLMALDDGANSTVTAKLKHYPGEMLRPLLTLIEAAPP